MTNINPLTPQLTEIAETELNENPKIISQDLNAFKSWLLKNSNIKSRTDDQFLIAFLRGCKFSLERAKEKLETYYRFRSDCTEFFGNRDPQNDVMIQVANLGTILPLPHPHRDCSRIVLSRVFSYDPDELKFCDILKYAFMIGDQLIMVDNHIVVAGVTVIVDLSGLSMAHAGQITPTYIKKVSTAIQDAYPFRQKGIHFINAPSIFDVIFKLFQTFLSSKLKKRLFLHDSLESLHKEIPKELLPEEYGGNGLNVESIENLTNLWKEKILSKREWFLNDEQFRVINESKLKSGNLKSKSELVNNSSGSIEGTFRSLEFD